MVFATIFAIIEPKYDNVQLSYITNCKKWPGLKGSKLPTPSPQKNSKEGDRDTFSGLEVDQNIFYNKKLAKTCVGATGPDRGFPEPE